MWIEIGKFRAQVLTLPYPPPPKSLNKFSVPWTDVQNVISGKKPPNIFQVININMVLP